MSDPLTITTIKPDSYDEATDTCTFPLLYKLDSTGKLRTWRMQRRGTTYRTLSGLADGKQAESGWTTCVGKQGRSDKGQAEFEIVAQYKHQLDREYHETPDTVSQPKMIEPMLAKAYDKWPGAGFAQPKLDGIRCIATAEGLFSRQGQPITAVPHIHAALAPLFAEYPDLTLDGELYNHDLREDFGAISSIVRKKNPTPEQLELAADVMQYHVYDTVDPDSTFADRALFIAAALHGLDCGWIIPVPTTIVRSAEQADEEYAKAIGLGYEGGMYRLDTPYEIGKRSKNLLKRKEFITEEFKLLRLEQGNGNWGGIIKRAVLQNNDGSGTEFGAGMRGKRETLAALVGVEVGEKATATLRFFQRTPDNVPRFPVVIDIQLEGRVD